MFVCAQLEVQEELTTKYRNNPDAAMLVSVSTESSCEGCEQQGDIRDRQIRFLLVSLSLTSSDSTPTHGLAPHITVLVAVVGAGGCSSVAVSHLTWCIHFGLE